MKLKNRDFLKEADFTPRELTGLLNLAASLKQAKKSGAEKRYLEGKNIALIFEKDSTRTRCAFEVAAHDQGASVTYLGPSGSQLGKKESIADTSRVLSGFFDGIEYRGFGQERVETLARYSDKPVWNGLTDEWHPTQFLADMLTMREVCSKPLNRQILTFVGDGRFNMANSLMTGAALLGLDYRYVGPRELWTSDEIFYQAQDLADKTGAKITRHESLDKAVRGADFIYTDVWVSMGEPEEIWEERINLLTPYRVTRDVLNKTGNPDCGFLHCLPAFHDAHTQIGQQIKRKFGLDCMEVSDDVFETSANYAFQEAENRMHTIKAVMVATMTDVELHP